jgi:glucose/arabinose dehydrogenase
MTPHARSLAVLAFALAACDQASSQTTIKFTNAYPNVKFDRPVYFGAFPGRAKANVVLEQHAGNALIVYQKDGGAIATDTLYHTTVNSTDNEMGLLGIAFHPDYNANRKYYIAYNPKGTPYYDIVEERIADATGMKDGGTGRILFKIDDPYSNHNGGTLAFGPKDGFLYYGVGDGGSGGDPNGNGQNTSVWLGKLHRIDVNSKDAGLEYHIPADNPFASGTRKEIMAYGLRNPWKWSFDPLTGDMWVGDVGQDKIEEVDLIPANQINKGGNYGWKIMEGKSGTNSGSMILPIFTYEHTTGNCVIGGVVYRGNPSSKYYGTYFVADNGTSKFWNLKANGTGDATVTNLNNTPTALSSFGTDAEGRIYACGLSNGTIYYLDDPDLTPVVALRAESPYHGPRGRNYTVRPGGSLEAGAFAASPVLEIFSLAGNRLGALRKEDARVPADMDAGLYLLKPVQGRGVPDLLRVR